MMADGAAAIRASIERLDGEIAYVNRLVFSDERVRGSRLQPLYDRQNELFAALARLGAASRTELAR